MLVPNMTIKGGKSQACAVCKYQRRKCSKDCPLAPYFPADKKKLFQDAHRLFGVSNIMKILKQVHHDQKEEAMRSIKYEADMRARFPVHGCLGVIWQLRFQLQQVVEELRYVRAWLDTCKDQCHYQNPPPLPSDFFPSSQSQLGIDCLPLYQHHSEHHPGINNAMPLSVNDFATNGHSGFYVETNDEMAKNLRLQHPYYNNFSNNSAMAAQSQSQLVVSQGYPVEMEDSHGYDDIPFDTMVDDRESYAESKDVYKSSAESSFKDTTQSIEIVTENELKNAAACFSLTSVS